MSVIADLKWAQTGGDGGMRCSEVAGSGSGGAYGERLLMNFSALSRRKTRYVENSSITVSDCSNERITSYHPSWSPYDIEGIVIGDIGVRWTVDLPGL
ncbi:hypothetical protein L2E82_20996 [Cichorium intybus]|uniref:Uncharacterized protein n=1 Tax=Cichorium intybus TaxID=13427 RepID=A0ACB9DUY4_CICIN|nr:hypothetical protein L2E82_20996 [Cichorium intybus]